MHAEDDFVPCRDGDVTSFAIEATSRIENRVIKNPSKNWIADESCLIKVWETLADKENETA